MGDVSKTMRIEMSAVAGRACLCSCLWVRALCRPAEIDVLLSQLSRPAVV